MDTTVGKGEMAAKSSSYDKERRSSKGRVSLGSHPTTSRSYDPNSSPEFAGSRELCVSSVPYGPDWTSQFSTQDRGARVSVSLLPMWAGRGRDPLSCSSPLSSRGG